MNAGRPSKVELGGDTDRIRSGALRKALKAGDPVVTDVLTRAAHYLAQGILTIRHLIDPDVVILGGGVVEACGAFLLPLIEQEVRADPMAGSRDVLRLVPSALGDDAVALGAAALLLADLGEADAAVEDAVEDADAIGSGPRIDRVEFGMVTVDGEELAHDVHIRANGKVRRRKKARLREQYGTSHLVDAEELAGVCKGSPEVVIIGRGFQSMLRLTEDARTFLEAADFDCRMLPTPEAVEAYNAATGRKALLLHVTC
jgi:glucokinase